MERRAAESIVLALGQQVPDENRDLTRSSNRGNLLSAPGLDADEEGVQWTRCRGSSPSRLDQKTACQRSAVLRLQ
jgi:hypothetical protein